MFRGEWTPTHAGRVHTGFCSGHALFYYEEGYWTHCELRGTFSDAGVHIIIPFLHPNIKQQKLGLEEMMHAEAVPFRDGLSFSPLVPLPVFLPSGDCHLSIALRSTHSSSFLSDCAPLSSLIHFSLAFLLPALLGIQM